MNDTLVQASQPVTAYGSASLTMSGHEPEPHNPSYQQYYLRVIDQQLQSNSFGGLKLVVGPTGMGKTSAIPGVMAYLRTGRVDKHCIYTSHRHLLIQEMAHALTKESIPFVYL